MLLNLSDLADEPLHRQVFRQIRAQILAGDLETGEALPSIRSLARDQRVSVITVQRAYDDLDRAGLIVSRPGKGCYVARLDESARVEMAATQARTHLEKAIRGALDEGLDAASIVQLVRDILEDDGGIR